MALQDGGSLKQDVDQAPSSLQAGSAVGTGERGLCSCSRHRSVDERRLAAVDSLAEFFRNARAIQGDGRPQHKLGQAMQAVQTAISHAPELGAVSLASISERLELGAHGADKIKIGFLRSEAFIDEGCVEALFDDRCKKRSDAFSKEQVAWLVDEGWLCNDFTRESEKKADEVYDPSSRQANREHHRLRWLELPLCGPDGFYAAVVAKGKEQWGADFHMSSTFIREHRPWWVKDPTRDVCLCRYHLEFDLLASAFNKLQTVIKCECSSCKGDKKIMTGRALQHALTCERLDGAAYFATPCVLNQCSKCADGGKLNEIICPEAQARAAEVDVKVEKYEKQCIGQDAVTKEDKYKHDFYEVTMKGNELLDYIKAKLVTFNPHQDLAAWQDQDWQHLKSEFPRGSFVTVQDFAENIHHTVRFEPQSKYWTQVSSTLYMVVVCFHLDDANHIPPEEKEELRAAFEHVNLPPVIVETHAFVSADG